MRRSLAVSIWRCQITALDRHHVALHNPVFPFLQEGGKCVVEGSKVWITPNQAVARRPNNHRRWWKPIANGWRTSPTSNSASSMSRTPKILMLATPMLLLIGPAYSPPWQTSLAIESARGRRGKRVPTIGPWAVQNQVQPPMGICVCALSTNLSIRRSPNMESVRILASATDLLGRVVAVHRSRSSDTLLVDLWAWTDDNHDHVVRWCRPGRWWLWWSMMRCLLAPDN